MPTAGNYSARENTRSLCGERSAITGVPDQYTRGAPARSARLSGANAGGRGLESRSRSRSRRGRERGSGCGRAPAREFGDDARCSCAATSASPMNRSESDELPPLCRRG